MADNEIRLISKIVRDKDIKPALDRGIEASWFVNPEARMMWEATLEHWGRYGNVPAAATLKDVLPGCTLLRVDESYDYLLDQFVEWRRQGLTTELLQQAAEKIEVEEDYDEARRILGAGLAAIEDIGIPASHDVDLTRTPRERIANYIALKNLPNGMRGIPTGFPTIDRATMGLQAGQLVTVVATPKAGKSTLVATMAKNIHGFGYTPGLVSFEMSNEEQTSRIDSMLTGIAHTHLLNGQLTRDDERDLHKLRDLEGKQPFILIADPTTTSTVSGLAAKLETYDPAVLIVDGVYLMRDEVSGEHNTPQALTNITRSLKRLAQRRQIPIVISTQALTWKLGKKKSVTADSIGYSSSFFQDSDVILGLQWNEDDDPEDERTLRVIASRNCGRVETTMMWDWTCGRFEEYDQGD